MLPFFDATGSQAGSSRPNQRSARVFAFNVLQADSDQINADSGRMWFDDMYQK
jgi:hypothetical protein